MAAIPDLVSLFRVLFLVLFIAIGNFASAQYIGGTANGDPTPREVQAAELSPGALQGDVDLFTKTLALSYPLGSVSTPSGLSFTLNTSYQSIYSSSNTQPALTGVPYGEGWSLDVPTISVSTEEYSKYTLDEMQLAPTSRPNNILDFDASEKTEEGKLYWFNPRINIPGVASGRLVYKYTSSYMTPEGPASAVFVLENFDSDNYIEAYLLSGKWCVRTVDGTWYIFKTRHTKFRSPTNQRVDGDAEANLVLPQEEILNWYVTEIRNPNMAPDQYIHFKYKGYGKFSYFQEISHLEQQLSNEFFFEQRYFKHPWGEEWGYLNSYTNEDPMEFYAYQEIWLSEIRSVLAEATRYDQKEEYETKLTYELLDLEYTSQEGSLPSGNILLSIGTTGVSIFDDLYNQKVVYSAGNAGASTYFNNWNRYYAIKHNELNSCSGSGLTPRLNNPFLDTDGKYHGKKESGTPSNLDFDHCFLESPRMGNGYIGTDEYFPPGDFYEVQAEISNANGCNGNFSSFDLNVIAGNPNQPEPTPSGITAIDAHTANGPVDGTGFEETRHHTVFSSFNRALKWSSRNEPTNLSASWFFQLSSLPKAMDGFRIQIGPANNDMKYDTDYTVLGVSGKDYPDASRAYFDNPRSSYFGVPPVNPEHLANTDAIPQNFGSGHPWRMLRSPMEKFADPSNYTGDVHPIYRSWWNKPPLSASNPDCWGTQAATCNSVQRWANSPTLAGKDVSLQELQVIRYSKKPLMLSMVRHYSINGSGYEDESLSLRLNRKVGLDYSFKTRRLINNEIYSSGSAAEHQLHEQVVALLESIYEIPTQPAIGGSDTHNKNQDNMSVYLKYSRLNVPDMQALRGVSSYYEHGSLPDSLWVPTSLTNNLGGITEFEYDNLFRSTKSYQYNLRNQALDLALIPSSHYKYMAGRGEAYTLYATIKKKKIQSGDSEYQELTYSTSQAGVERVYLPFGGSFIPELFRDFPFSVRAGFPEVKVQESGLASGNVYEKVYHFHTGRNLWGRLKKVEQFSNDELVQKTISNWNYRKAFENGMLRDGSGHNSELFVDQYFDYDPGTTGISGTHAGELSVDIQNAFKVHYILNSSHFFQDLQAESNDYLNSYFIYKSSEDSREYAPGPFVQSPKDSIATHSLFEYFDADHTGLTQSSGYQKIFDDSTGSIQLRFEPSWQLYRQRTTNPAITTGYFEEQENFYYYDQMNDPYYKDLWKKNYASSTGDWVDSRPHEHHGLNLTFLGQHRKLPMEIRRSSDYGREGIHSQSEYFEYNHLWVQTKDGHFSAQVFESKTDPPTTTEGTREVNVGRLYHQSSKDRLQQRVLEPDGITIDVSDWWKYGMLTYPGGDIAFNSDIKIIPDASSALDIETMLPQNFKEQLDQELRLEIAAIADTLHQRSLDSGYTGYQSDANRAMLRAAVAEEISWEAIQLSKRMDRWVQTAVNEPENPGVLKVYDDYTAQNPGAPMVELVDLWTQNAEVYEMYAELASHQVLEARNQAESIIANFGNDPEQDTVVVQSNYMILDGALPQEVAFYSPLWLTRHWVQTDDQPLRELYDIEYTPTHVRPILRFKKQSTQKVNLPSGFAVAGRVVPLFPFETMLNLDVRERNSFGNVVVQEQWKSNEVSTTDEWGLITRFDYNVPEKRMERIRNTNLYRKYFNISNANLPTRKQETAHLYGSNHGLIHQYEYNLDNSLKKITDPNGETSAFRYDNLGRLDEMDINNELVQKYTYQTVSNLQTSINFSGLALQNKHTVRTYLDSERSLFSSSYLDPLGRSHQEVSTTHHTTNGYGQESVHTGQTSYDERGRVISEEKSFSLNTQNGTAYSVPPSGLLSLSHKYETDGLGRMIESADFGQSIGGTHNMHHSYDILSGAELAIKLNLSNELKDALLISTISPASDNVFRGQSYTDQDGNTVTTYTDFFGHTVAEYRENQKEDLANPGTFTAEDVLTISLPDNLGLPWKTIDPEGFTRTYLRNLMGWVYREEIPESGTKTYLYNRSGSVVLEYDNKARHQAELLGPVNAIYRHYEYDKYGRLIKQERISNASTQSGGSTWEEMIREKAYASVVACEDMNGPSVPPSPTYEDCFLHTYQLMVLHHDTTQARVYHPIAGWDNRTFYAPFYYSNTYCWTPQYSQIYKSNSPYYLDFLDENSKKIEKTWTYGVSPIDCDGVAFCPHLSAVQADVEDMPYNKGRLSKVVSYEHENVSAATPLPVHYAFYEYDSKGNLTLEVQQFRAEGVSVAGRGDAYKITYGQYNRQGQPGLQTIDLDYDGTVDYTYRYTYDDWGRPHEQMFGEGTFALADKQFTKVVNGYDDRTGQLTSQLYTEAGSGQSYSTITNVQYAYQDDRDRLTSISSDYFDEFLYYGANGPSPGRGLTAPVHGNYYNGNINGITADYKLAGLVSSLSGSLYENSGKAHYGYTYDKLNRLSRADATVEHYALITPQPANAYETGDVRYAYNRRGDMERLERDKAAGPEHLTFEYTGSKLFRVKDVIPLLGVNLWTYSYDQNGMISSDGQNIGVTTAGRANQPFKLDIGGESNDYLYNTEDWRIYKAYENSGSPTEEFYLIDGGGNLLGILDMQQDLWDLRLGQLMQYEAAEGGNPARSTYYLHDHLGNMRVAFYTEGDGNYHLEQAIDFFPYGKELRQWVTGDAQKFLTTGNERDVETGWDYRGARFYQSSTGRFLSEDPLFDQFPHQSSYMGLDGNPISKIDPDGRTAISTIEDNDDIYIHGSDGNTLTIKAPGEDIHVNVGLEIGESRSMDLGIERIEDFAIGYQITAQGVGAAGVGSSHAFLAHNVMFFNLEYGGYWYTYTGGETALRAEVGFDAGLSLNGSMFLAISRTGNYNPESFAGGYYTGGLNPAKKVILQANANAQVSISDDWMIIEAGAGIGAGLSFGFGGIFAGGGKTVLLNDVKKTNERSWFEIGLNQLLFNPLSPIH